MDIVAGCSVQTFGDVDAPPIVFAHGFGCDHRMWRHLVPAFTDAYRVVLFDLVGFGESDTAAFDPERYASLTAYAEDVVAILDALDLRDVTFVGHSVSAMIGVLASIERPDRIARLVLVGPSPRYLDDEGYTGGFAAADIDELLVSLESNYLGWSAAMAPVIMDNPDHPELADELRDSFCRVDPVIARHVARTTFLADNRADLPRVEVPTLVLQCSVDAIAPVAVGAYVQEQIRGSELVVLDAVGHCPHLSAPDATRDAIRGFVDRHRGPA